MNKNDSRLQPLNYSIIKVSTQKERNNYFFIIKYTHAQAQTCAHAYGRISRVSIISTVIQTEIGLTGTKYRIHPNKG